YSIAGGDGAVGVPMVRMGDMELFNRETPDGYPEYGQAWVSAGTLSERVRYVTQLLMPTSNTNKNDQVSSGNPSGGSVNRNISNPFLLARAKLTDTQMASVDNVSDLFVNLIFPGEGRVNLDSYKQAAISWLNHDDLGAPDNWSGLIAGSGY